MGWKVLFDLSNVDGLKLSQLVSGLKLGVENKKNKMSKGEKE